MCVWNLFSWKPNLLQLLLKVVKETDSKMKFWVWVTHCLPSNEGPFLAANGVLTYHDILTYTVVV